MTQKKTQTKAENGKQTTRERDDKKMREVPGRKTKDDQ